MGKFINHDAIASGVLNRDFNSATSTQAAWQGELLNSPQVLDLLLDRMGKDWSSLHVKMRKPYTAKDLDAWCCWVLTGAFRFLHNLSVFALHSFFSGDCCHYFVLRCQKIYHSRN